MEDIRINLPNGEKEINLVLTFGGAPPLSAEINSAPMFDDNPDASLFNAEISVMVPEMKMLSIPPDPFNVAAAAFGNPAFIKEHIGELIEGGFLNSPSFSYIKGGKPRAASQPHYMAAAILFHAAATADYCFLTKPAVMRYLRGALTKNPGAAREALLLYELNDVAHDLIGDRLFTVTNCQALRRLCPGLTEWTEIADRKKLDEFADKASLPRAYRLLSIFTKIYGIRVQNDCLSVRPPRCGLPSITIKLGGKEIFVTFAQGHPRKTYLGNLAYDGSIKISDLPDDRVTLTVTC